MSTHCVDAIFLSPPWGGPEYKVKPDSSFDIEKDIPVDGFKIFNTALKVTENICYFLPRNSNVEQIVSMAGENNHVEVEQNLLNGRLKTISAYFGNLVSD